VKIDHNFSHVEKSLSFVLFLLNLLAFAYSGEIQPVILI